MKHSLRRTSPKGGPFVGVCVLCGKQGLTIAQSQDDCANVLGKTADEVLLDAIKGEEKPKAWMPPQDKYWDI
jgi:hypothetical protein